MTRNTKIFLASLLASIPLWLGFNVSVEKLQNVFFWNEIAKNPDILAAQALPADFNAQIRNLKPQRRAGTAEFSSSSRAALTVYVTPQGKTKTLFSKQSDIPFPIASLAKLMSSRIVAERYPLAEKVLITKEAVQKEESIGNLRIGEELEVQELLESMLVESSNDAAQALSGVIGNDLFVHLMNSEAEKLGLGHSTFSDPAGVDPDEPGTLFNAMSAEDLMRLAIAIKEEHPEITSLLSQKQIAIRTPEGRLHHTAKSTNELLQDPSFPLKILAGKTGWTPLSEGCLLLITEAPNQTGYIVSIVLGSEDRFGEMKSLTQWIVNSYDF